MPNESTIQWFRDAKFGMFVHWGVYSLLEDGEWVMYARRIPVKEYEKLAARFNPVGFDADAWVRTAKAAGMKYIVITAKHHDGFSMFKTKVSPFNIVDATPFGRDVMAELCEACRREGLKLGFYYSHVREWRHPMAQSFEAMRPDRLGNYGNFWDYPDESRKDLDRYIDEFDMPQLKELLTQYGDILTIWFDTPSMIKPAQAEKLRDLVHALQPECMVNNRLSYDIETDYSTMGDCEVPASGADKAWDTPMTTTHGAWGYSVKDSCRPSVEFIRELCEVASKGGNYLLNVGPTSLGLIPDDTVTQLRQVGDWLAVNGEAIYGASAAGLCYKPTWGVVTRRDDVLYMIVTEDAVDTASLTGVENGISACRLLGGGDCAFTKRGHTLTVDLGGKGAGPRVVRVELDGPARVTGGVIPADDGSIQLDCPYGAIRVGYEYSHITLINGATRRWFSAEDTIDWTFTTYETGDYDIEIVNEVTFIGDAGHELDVDLDGQTFCATIPEAENRSWASSRMYVSAGRVEGLTPGVHTLKIRPRVIKCENMVGLTIYGARLVKR